MHGPLQMQVTQMSPQLNRFTGMETEQTADVTRRAGVASCSCCLLQCGPLPSHRPSKLPNIPAALMITHVPPTF